MQYEAEKQEKLRQLEETYRNNLNSIGDGHQEAVLQVSIGDGHQEAVLQVSSVGDGHQEAVHQEICHSSFIFLCIHKLIFCIK